VNKCQSTHFTRSRPCIYHTYSINNINLTSISRKKDLEVLFSLDLSFYYHIQSISYKAYKTLGFVKRTSFDFKLTFPLKALYFSLAPTTPAWIWIYRILTQLRLCNHWTSSKAISILCRKRVEYFLPDAWLLTSSMHELGLSTLADRKVDSNLNSLRNLIDGSAIPYQLSRPSTSDPLYRLPPVFLSLCEPPIIVRTI